MNQLVDSCQSRIIYEHSEAAVPLVKYIHIPELSVIDKIDKDHVQVIPINPRTSRKLEQELTNMDDWILWPGSRRSGWSVSHSQGSNNSAG